MRIIFVTTNPGKMGEAKEIGREFGIEFLQDRLDCTEIQADSTEDIAIESAKEAWKDIKKPLIVEDSGVFIKALGGFPGPYSAYVYKTIGTDGITKLMKGVRDRSAVMKSAVVYTDGKVMKTFLGEVKGDIPNKKRGKKGFGYDPVFVPEGRKRTFGEDPAYKNQVSHRAQALRRFCKWHSAKHA